MSCDPHIFSSKTKSWSIKVVRLDDCGVMPHGCLFDFTSAFALGGGSMAWVDHWNGILLCDGVDGDDPKARLIELPPLLPVNAHFAVGWDGTMPCLDRLRDVTFNRNDGCFRFIEVGSPRLDAQREQLNFRWKAAVSKINSDKWEPCGTVGSATLSPTHSCFPYLFPEILKENKLALNNMITSFPTLDPHKKNVCYMMAKMKAADSDGWVLVVNTKTKRLNKIVPFSSETVHLHRTYMLCDFSKHLTHASGAGNSIGWMHDIIKEDPLVLYVISVLLVQQKFRQFGKYFTEERPSAIMIWSLLHIGVSSAMDVHIHRVAQYAAKIGLGKAACDDENTFQRALKDVGNLLLRLSASDAKALGDQISVAVEALDKLVHMVPSRMLYLARSMVSVDESVNSGMSVPTLSESFGKRMIINAEPCRS